MINPENQKLKWYIKCTEKENLLPTGRELMSDPYFRNPGDGEYWNHNNYEYIFRKRLKMSR